MPRACSMSAVVRPPIPPPAIMTFMPQPATNPDRPTPIIVRNAVPAQQFLPGIVDGGGGAARRDRVVRPFHLFGVACEIRVARPIHLPYSDLKDSSAHAIDHFGLQALQDLRLPLSPPP